MSQLEELWQLCLNYIKDAEIVSEKEFDVWLKSLQTRVQDGILEIVAANALVYDFVQKKFWYKIEPVINEFMNGAPIKLVVLNSRPKIDLSVNTDVVINQPVEKAKNENKNLDKAHSSNVKTVTISKSNKVEALNERQIREQMHNSTKLIKAHTFDTFVRGNSNQLAVAIGMHVTQELGNRNHNPLFIYGGVGLGKTHLMQAIGNEVYRKNPNAKIRYLHANDYIQDVVKASMSSGFDAFKKYYHNLDLLLMDDIQFIAGDRTKTQEEFFYTFNNLIEKGRQVIMTCDTYPKNITNLNDRLISRFASGLTVEIQPPELEMRVAILKHKALRSAKLELDDEIAFFIAQNIKSNVRELEGALNKVIYHARFSKVGLTVGVAKEALLEIIAGESRVISIEDIQKTVCDYYKVKLSELLSKKRTQLIARPRQVAMSIAKELTQLSLPSIGAAFGGRDHATVIHAQKTIAELRDADEKLDRDYKLLLQMLQS